MSIFFLVVFLRENAMLDSRKKTLGKSFCRYLFEIEAMDTVQQIKHKLEQAHTIAIFGHRSIDGDALGAMYGLGLQLEAL